jgi:signal transduction histidine kinase
MIMELSDEYAKRGLAVELSEIERNIFVNIDPVLFRTVIINVLENSVKYKTQETGKVRIKTTGGQMAEIRLLDDGPGVPPETLDKLFDVFYRTDPARSTTGSGLGLAISAKIITLMGGTIRAESGAGGKGLDIVISFPMAANTEAL